MFITVVVMSIQVSAYLYCNSPVCSSCSQGVLFKERQCLPNCPYPQNKSQTPCNAKYDFPFFDLEFENFKLFSASSINDFSTPGNLPFKDQSKTGPLPTFSQGFYFTNNSSLKWTTDRSISSNFYFDVCGIFKKPGKIFQMISNGMTYFQLSTDAYNIILEILLKNSTESFLEKVTMNINSINWDYFSFNIYHSLSGTFCITIYKRDSSKFITYNKKEFMPPEFDIEFVFGSDLGNGFEGFLLKSRFYFDPVSFYNFNDFRDYCLCDYNEYCDKNNICQKCQSECNDWPWCLHSTCSYCYSSECSECSNYLYSGCNYCHSENKMEPDCECGPFCKSCNKTFECLSCEDTYVLIENKCISQPYNINERLIDYTFKTFEQFKGNLMQSGDNPDTFFPLSHELDDPWILAQRGGYLNKTRFFKSKSSINFILNYQFCLSAWVMDDVYFDFGNLKIDSKSRIRIKLVSRELTAESSLRFWGLSTNYWNFIHVCCKFENSATIISIRNNNTDYSPFTSEGFIFISDGGNFKIGSEGNGLIYYLAIDQKYTEPPSNYLEKSSDVGCFFYQYFNTYLKTCMNCDINFVIPCNSFGTSSMCKYSECSTCNSFEEICSKNISANCSVNLVYINDKCCYNRCNDCFESSEFSCLSCFSPFLLLGHTCVEVCPTGFTKDSQKCIESVSLVVDIKFDNFLYEFNDLSIYGNLIKAGNETVVYPNVFPSHPLPVFRRGFYFSSNSSVKIGNISLSYNYSIIFIVKPIGAGQIFAQENFKVEIRNSYIYINDLRNGKYNYFQSVKNNTWNRIEISFYGIINNIQIVKNKNFIFPNTDLSGNSASFNNISFKNEPIDLQLGSEKNSFKGFLWVFQLFNSLSFPSYQISICSNSITSDCLIDCSLTQYYNKSCESCTNCPLGCVRRGSCELCLDPLCSKCENFTSQCLECKANSLLKDGNCTCLKNSYFNDSTNSCDPCINNCISCTSLQDCQCFNNSHAIDLNCVCDSHYWKDLNESCSICHSWCENCYNDKFYTCLSCSNYLLGSVCVNECPFGYQIKGNTCNDGGGGVSLKFRFDRLDGKFRSNDVMMSCGISDKFYPDFDHADPWPAYQRGLFFQRGKYCSFSGNGVGYFLGIRFGISLWFNLVEKEGFALSAYDSSGLILSIYLGNNEIVSSIFLESLYSSSFPYSLEFKTWFLLILNVEYDFSSMISIGINEDRAAYIYLSEYPFNITEKALFCMGSDHTFQSSFKGFIFDLSFYKSPQILNTFIDNSNCLSDNLQSSCIPSCDLNSFPEDNGCKNCLNKCLKGCRSNSSCNLCEDLNCFKCFDYEKGSCTVCLEEFKLFKGICVSICDQTQFFDENDLTCKNCPNLCNSCNSTTFCLNCTENAEVNSSQLCQCRKGFNGTSFCSRIYFYAYMKLSSDNIATIIFTEPLLKILSNENISASIENFPVNFSIKTEDMIEFQLKFYFKKDVKLRDQLILIFQNEITSKNNSLLYTKILTILMFPYTIPISDNSTILFIKESVSTASIVVLSASLGFSAINFDIRSFLNLQNTAEMFSVMIIFDFGFDDKMKAYLSQIHKSSSIPSYIEKFIPSSKGIILPKKFYDYGYKTNLILLNCGMFFTMFFAFLAIYTFAKIIHKIKVNPVTIKLLNYLEFDAFFKLWTQSFLEISVCSLLGVMNSEFSNSLQVFDFSLCLFMLVKFK